MSKSKSDKRSSVTSNTSGKNNKSAKVNGEQAKGTARKVASSSTLTGARIEFDLNNNEIVKKSDGECVNNDSLSTNDKLNNYDMIASINSNSTSSSASYNVQSPTLSTQSALSSTPYSQPKASSKSNDRFHQLFPSIPIEEYVIETYSCAYAKSLNLYQGVMFLTNNYICFYSKILTHTNILILKFNHIISITKAMHAVIFPTAIRIETKNSTYSFTSFRSRSNTLDHLSELLQQSRQRHLHEMNCKSMETPKEERSEELIVAVSRKSKSDREQDRRTYTSSLISNSSSNSQLIQETDSCKSIDYSIDAGVGGNSASSKLKDSLLDVKSSSLSSSSFDVTGQQFFNHNHRNSDYCQYYNSQNSSHDFFYDFDFSKMSKNMVTVSLRPKKTLAQKIKILMSILIPGFFDISRIDALLPICFVMCILLLLNAFVLLNKVNQVDDLFSKLLTAKEL